MVHMFDFLWRRLMNGWSGSSRESRLGVSAGGCQGSLGFDRCQTQVILYLRKGLLELASIQIRAVAVRSSSCRSVESATTQPALTRRDTMSIRWTGGHARTYEEHKQNARVFIPF